MVKNITSKEFINLVSFDKKENRLLTRLTKCKTRKCAKINKERLKECTFFEKELEEQCHQKDIKAWQDCLVDFDKYGSKCRTLNNKFVKCGRKKCSKELKTFKTYKNKIQRNIKYAN